MTAAEMPGELGSTERKTFLWSLPATVELTHNHGSESQEGPVYHTGNNYDGVNEGFGHLGITVWKQVC
jgi:lactoylglutathione lyase